MNDEKWTSVLKPREKLLRFNLGEIWDYRDLVFLFVKRNFTTIYKQTVLGPAWILITPLITTVIQTLVFGNIADLSTNGSPQFLFYMCGNLIWGFISGCATDISGTFTNNSAIFGKVYFPRMVMPITTMFTQLINFFIRTMMFGVFWAYYIITGVVHPNRYMLLIPIFMFIAAMISVGFGIIISSLTTKYRDLKILVSFGINLWMYITPVVYPLSTVTGIYRTIIMLNPATAITEGFRYAILGTGEFPLFGFIYSLVFSFILMFIGLIMFNRVDKTFMDTV